MVRSGLNFLALLAAATLVGGCEIQAQSFGSDGSFDRTLGSPITKSMPDRMDPAVINNTLPLAMSVVPG